MSSKESFTQISPSEFFYRNRDLAGFSNPTRSLYTAVREFVENSLDACDQKGNLPAVAISGMGLGIFEEWADYLLGTEFRIAAVFSLLVIILVYRRFKLSRKREYLK